MNDDELFALVKRVDPRSVRLPPGIKEIDMFEEGTKVVASAGFGESAKGSVAGTRVTTCGGKVVITEYLVRFDDGEDLGYFDDDGASGYMFPGCDGEKAWVNADQVTPNDLGNRRAAFGASVLTDELCGNGSKVGAGDTAMKGKQ